MLQITTREIAEITGGTLVGGATGDEQVTGTARIDSREVTPGDLFAAFHGEHVDGHDYLEAARTAGASAALVTEDRGTPAVRVPDVLEALSTLARAQLERARVEHPELVAQRLERFSRIVGPERVIGSTACGLGGRIHPQIAWAKLESLAEGAKISSRRL